MFRSTTNSAEVSAQQNRETVTLNDLKRQLGFRRSDDTTALNGFTEATIDAYLMRFLKAKRLSTSEAVAKLKRRRAFESTLPTISVTPAVISALRSGAFSILGNDRKGRPVLFLSLRNFSLPPIEVDEAQRILILLLEFMMSKCMSNTNKNDNSGENSNVNGISNTSTSFAENSTSNTSGGSNCPQSFVLLIDEEGAPWSVHLPLLRKASTLYSIFSKYYPGLVELVLVAEATFEVRQGIQAALAGSRGEISRMVLMVQRSDISRYMSEDVTPACLGGKLQTSGNALAFAEAVLRHWYTVTSFLQLENNTNGGSANTNNTNGKMSGGGGGGARPLYLPPPLMSDSAQFVSLQYAAKMAASAAALTRTTVKATAAASTMISGIMEGGGQSSGPGKLPSTRRPSASLFSINNASPGYMSAVQGDGNDLTSQMSNTHAVGRGAADDGICSELSADDITIDERGGEDEDGAELVDGKGSDNVRSRSNHHCRRSLRGCGGGSSGMTRPLDVEEANKVRSDPNYAVDALTHERGLRIEAEQKLRIAELGVALDPQNISSVEKQLASVHSELNVLVADVVLRARVARQQPQGEATVSQLLDLTLTALEAAAAVPEEVPAMKLAVPHQREPQSSICCSVM